MNPFLQIIKEKIDLLRKNYEKYSQVLKLQRESLSDRSANYFAHYSKLESKIIEKIVVLNLSLKNLLKDLNKNNIKIEQDLLLEIQSIEELRENCIKEIDFNQNFIEEKKEEFKEILKKYKTKLVNPLKENSQIGKITDIWT